MANPKLLCFSLLALLLLVMVVKADVAPPMIIINVTYDGVPVNGTFNMSALICTNSSNASATPVSVQKIGPSYDAAKGCYWSFSEQASGATCQNGECILYYLPSITFKAVFYLPILDKTFITNEVNTSDYDTQYRAQLYSNGSATIAVLNNNQILPIPPIPPNPYSLYEFFFFALILTLVIEGAVAFLYLRYKKIKKLRRILIAVLLANIISVPILWFIFVYFLAVSGFILGEIFAVLFEGYFVYYFNKKMIKLKSAMALSLIMNLTSLIFGGMLLISLIGLLG